MTVPNEIKQFTSNARHYLEASIKFPPPTNNAVHILLLIDGWENIVIADRMLHAWAMDEQVDPKLLRDHEAKLNNISKDAYIQRFVPNPKKPWHNDEITYAAGRELKKLREMCVYGLSTDTREVSKLFDRHWISDNFSRSLKNKIEWTEMSVEAFEALD